MVKGQLEAKRIQELDVGELRAQKLKLMRENFEQYRLKRQAQRKEDRRDRRARSEEGRKNLELIVAIINKLN